MSAYDWSCSAETQECYDSADYTGRCLQDTEAVALYWEDTQQQTPSAALTSEQFGTSLFVRPIGDVNGDGKADLIVVEQGGNDFLQQQLYLFLGRTSFSGEILLGTASATWSAPAAVPGFVTELPLLVDEHRRGGRCQRRQGG